MALKLWWGKFSGEWRMYVLENEQLFDPLAWLSLQHETIADVIENVFGWEYRIYLEFKAKDFSNKKPTPELVKEAINILPERVEIEEYEDDGKAYLKVTEYIRKRAQGKTV